MKRSIGSSYLIDQRAGGEQVGGLEITLQFPIAEPGTIQVNNTLRGTEETRDDIDDYTSEAKRGVIEYARENQIDLAQFDITLGQFFVHDVNSRPFLYYVAGKNAFQSALAAWKPPSQFNNPDTNGS